jgi:SAM-dependent methyltransferase
VDTGTNGERKASEIDGEVVRETIREFVQAHDEEARRWLANVLVSTPLLQTVLREQSEHVLERLVRAEIAASPLAARAASPARTLALFHTADANKPLPPAKAHLSGTHYIPLPASVMGEPIQALLERDPYPLPTTLDREGYHGDRHLDYWLSGLEDFVRVRATLDRHGRALAAPFAVLDFGCASGRVLRHFLCQVRGLDLWGADLNERHVEWLLRHLPRALKPFQCTTLPHLPLQDESLDLVTAFSVFTHIDEYEIAWLLELRRAEARRLRLPHRPQRRHLGPPRPGRAPRPPLRGARRDPRVPDQPELFGGRCRATRPSSAGARPTSTSRTCSCRGTTSIPCGALLRSARGRAPGLGYQDVVVLRKPELLGSARAARIRAERTVGDRRRGVG